MMSSTTASEVLRAIAARPMNSFQSSTVGLCLLINILDGFDVLSISFAAPMIAQEWSLQPAALGVLFSSGLAGMVFASLFISSIADYIGRRTTILCSLAIITVGMAATGFAESIASMIFWRFVVGLGVGTVLPSLNTLVAEFSSSKRRELGVAIMQAGFPTGAVLGGVIAVIMIPQFGWRGIFWTGAGFSLIALVLAYLRLPESLDYLLNRQPTNAITRANHILSKLAYPALQELPGQTEQVRQALGFRALMQPRQLRNTLFLSLAFFFAFANYYFVASWTPKLLVDAGLSLSEGISGGVVLSLGGIVGGLLLGGVSSRWNVRLLTMGYLLCTIPMMLLFSMTSGLQSMLVVAFAMGFFLLGSIIGLYALTPGLFDSNVRATATGVVIGIGRFGAILGPGATGFMLEQGWQAMHLYQVVGLLLLLSAGALVVLHRQASRLTTA